MDRSDKIYMAYRLSLSARKKQTPDQAANEILAMIHTAKSFKISVFTMLDIVKKHGK